MTHKRKKLLDNTLRYLYIALRNAGAYVMAIEFMHRGKRWRADTIEEAVQLRTRLEAEDRKNAIDPEGDREWDIRRQSVWTPDVFE